MDEQHLIIKVQRPMLPSGAASNNIIFEVDNIKRCRNPSTNKAKSAPSFSL